MLNMKSDRKVTFVLLPFNFNSIANGQILITLLFFFPLLLLILLFYSSSAPLTPQFPTPVVFLHPLIFSFLSLISSSLKVTFSSSQFFLGPPPLARIPNHSRIPRNPPPQPRPRQNRTRIRCGSRPTQSGLWRTRRRKSRRDGLPGSRSD